jgi:fibronectin type 3 domain-containing protein
VTGVIVTPVSCTQLDVSWTANPESDLDHYNVYRNESRVASPTTNSYSDTGLTASTTYYYKVTAVDNPSNEGAPSDEKSGTTAADAAGPVTSDVVAEPNPTNGAETVTLTATVSDSTTCNSIIADAEYFVNVTGDNGDGTAMNASDGEFDAVTEAVTADMNVSDWPVGSYTLYVHGRDKAGKWGETSAVVLEVTEMPTNVMHVHSINMSLSKRTAGKNIFTHATAVVTVVNTTGITVDVATVEGHWSIATTDSDSDLTNSTGQVSLDSDEVKKALDGTNFTFTVDDLIKSGWTYDPTANEQTSGTIIVGDGFGISSVGAGTAGTSAQNQGFYQTRIAPAIQHIIRILTGGGGE